MSDRLAELTRRNLELEDEVAALKAIIAPKPPDEYRALGLSKSEAAILRVLYLAYPEIVPLERIEAAIGDTRAGDTRKLIAAYCFSIRRKLGKHGVKIVNEYSVGYRLESKSALDALGRR